MAVQGLFASKRNQIQSIRRVKAKSQKKKTHITIWLPVASIHTVPLLLTSTQLYQQEENSLEPLELFPLSLTLFTLILCLLHPNNLDISMYEDMHI